MLRRVAHLPTLSGCKHQLHGAAFCFFRFYCIQKRAYVFLVGAHPNGQLATVGEKRKIKGGQAFSSFGSSQNCTFWYLPPIIEIPHGQYKLEYAKKKKKK